MAEWGPVSPTSLSSHYTTLMMYLFGAWTPASAPSVSFAEWMVKDMQSQARSHWPWLTSINDKLWILTAKKPRMKMCCELTRFPNVLICSLPLLLWHGRENKVTLYVTKARCDWPQAGRPDAEYKEQRKVIVSVYPALILLLPKRHLVGCCWNQNGGREGPFVWPSQVALAFLEQMTPQA